MPGLKRTAITLTSDHDLKETQNNHDLQCITLQEQVEYQRNQQSVLVTLEFHKKELPLTIFKIIVHKIRIITKCGETRRSN